MNITRCSSDSVALLIEPGEIASKRIFFCDVSQLMHIFALEEFCHQLIRKSVDFFCCFQSVTGL